VRCGDVVPVAAALPYNAAAALHVPRWIGKA
jgi:hypothetical protein